MVAHGIDGTLRTTTTTITSSVGGVGGHWMGLEKCAHCAVYKKYAWQGESHVHSRVSSIRLCYPMSVVGVMSQHGLTFAKGERWSFPVPKHYKTECPNIIIHNFARPKNKWKKFPHWSIKYCIWRDFMQVPMGWPRSLPCSWSSIVLYFGRRVMAVSSLGQACQLGVDCT